MQKIWMYGIAGFGAVVSLLLSSCVSMDTYIEERAERAVVDTQKAKYLELPDGHAYTLDECIEYALKHNLQVRLHEMDVNVAQENKIAEALGMLPELNINDNFSGRTNTPASSSQKIAATGATYGYSTSEERQVNYLNIDLAFSVLDFGLSYWNTELAHNKMLLHKKRAIRVSQNIQLDVVKAYFKVAAAQRAKNKTEKLLEETRVRTENVRKLSAAGKVDPILAFNFLRKFTYMEKQLANYVKVYESACVELRTLMGLYPSPMINVDEDYLEKLPGTVDNLPEITLMEQIALLQRPELYETDLQKQINIIECRKVILMMFPNVRLYADWSNSSNLYLYHQSWMELGLRAAYNLLSLPHQIAKYSAYSQQVETEILRTYAQSLAVMAQVRMGHANLISSIELYRKDKAISNDYKTHLENARKIAKSGGSKFNGLDVDYMSLETVKAEIDSVLSMGNCYVAFFRLINAMGIDNCDFRTIDALQEELSDASIAAKKQLEIARRTYDEEQIRQYQEELKAKRAAEAKAAEAEDAAMRKEVNAEIDKKIKTERAAGLSMNVKKK